jgi:disulfide bond formation protein DsbB
MEISPCLYCKAQRWGYFLLAPLALIGLFIQRKRGLLRLIQWLLLIIFIVAAVHTFKELFNGTCSCTVGAATWKIFGITASIYSGILAAALFIFTHLFLRKK